MIGELEKTIGTLVLCKTCRQDDSPSFTIIFLTITCRKGGAYTGVRWNASGETRKGFNLTTINQD